MPKGMLITILTIALIGGNSAICAPMKWSEDALKQATQWYGSKEAQAAADVVLSYQSEFGAWPKNTDLFANANKEERAALQQSGSANTIDNDATTAPIRFLALVAFSSGDVRYRDSVLRGVDYLLAAQYSNGGFPQFHPLREGYYSRITYNDDAMVNALELLRDVATSRPPFGFVDGARRDKARNAVERGIDVILKTQVRQEGKPTAWCAQHDEVTLAPAWARAYEPPSLSGNESVGIVRFLMGIETPSPHVVAAIEAAVGWLRAVSISGQRVETTRRADGRHERVLVPDPTAPALWARFYELGTNRPLYMDRDSKPKYDFSQIGYERRSGYAYHGTWPASLLERDYPAWRSRVADARAQHGSSSKSPADGWYSQGDFRPEQRVALILRNPLARERQNTPVTIRRDELARLPDVHELAITLVDPVRPGRPEPSAELFRRQGGHETRRESNGAWIPYQLDDLDQDGRWDELFFMADFAAEEQKVFYLYLGFHNRGWHTHATHAGIGSYARHIVPFWESENIGWKLWFPTDIDVYGKRRPILISHRLYMENLDGYGVSAVDPAYGSDIMQVGDSFGGGGIGVFDIASKPNVVSRPRFTPRSPGNNFNAGAQGDSRYAFTVLANGPVRSVIRARTFNWSSGHGNYELEQLYAAYAGQSYSTARVKFSVFEPDHGDAAFAVGMRKHPDENSFHRANGLVITGAPEAIRNQDDDGLRANSLVVDFVGTALVVPEKYSPEYAFVPERGGNHVFRIRPDKSRSFEYLIAAGWSEGNTNRTPSEFKTYTTRVAEEFSAPMQLIRTKVEFQERPNGETADIEPR